MEDAMTVAELIEYLKTLNQDYTVELGDSEYPNEKLSRDSITEGSNKNYIFY